MLYTHTKSHTRVKFVYTFLTSFSKNVSDCTSTQHTLQVHGILYKCSPYYTSMQHIRQIYHISLQTTYSLDKESTTEETNIRIQKNSKKHKPSKTLATPRKRVEDLATPRKRIEYLLQLGRRQSVFCHICIFLLFLDYSKDPA